MDDRQILELLILKADKLDDRLDDIDKTLVRQHEQLKEHIKRTNINEQNLAMIRDEIKPVQRHVIIVEWVMKLLGAGGVLFVMIKDFFHLK